MFTFLFDDNTTDGGALLFENPREIVGADDADEVRPAIGAIAAAQQDGLYAAGFLGFELGFLTLPKLAGLLPNARPQPLLMFGLFDEPKRLSSEEAGDWLRAKAHGAPYQVQNLRPSLDEAGYTLKFDRALAYIAAGDIYQLNLTFKAAFDFKGSAAALFLDLRRKQHVPYGAFIETPDFTILSLSPELFIDANGGKILTRPMKGTAPRGFTAAGDDGLKAWLASDVKSRAENLMIVDLMRNDVSRVARAGTVEVPDLFTVETFETVLQMTSGVKADLREDVRFPGLLEALFPPGSITGAPKLRAVEIIRELEDGPRGVYTGAVGFLRPIQGGLFNVAIRTLFIDRDGAGEAGIGSGVVQDSRAKDEYEECLLKLKFLSGPLAPEYELLETLRYGAPDGYTLLDRHIARMESSARRLGFAFTRTDIEDALATYSASLGVATPHRVRVTQSRAGKITITSTALPAVSPAALTFALAPERMDPSNLYLYHKTTNRAFYDDARTRLSLTTGCGEAIFLNTQGQLTEGSFTNIFVEVDGGLSTPAVSCGLLAGTLRQEMLENGEAVEAVLTLEDLLRAKAVWLGNSVRGLVPAQWVDAQAFAGRAAE